MTSSHPGAALRRFPLFLIVSLISLSFSPLHPANAQGLHELAVQAFQCPVGYVGSHADEHCTDLAPDETFSLTLGSGPDATPVDAITNENGIATFDIPSDVSTVRLGGPVFFWSTTSDHPRPLLQAGCYDHAWHEIESMGGNPGPNITLESIPEGEITCLWYIGADNGNHSAWQGGYPDLVPRTYPGEFVSIYGAQSDYPAASVTFELDAVPDRDMTLDITGIDDELDAKVDLSATLNGEAIFEGPSDFPNWIEGMIEPGHMIFTLPVEALQQGHNVFTLSNLEPDANFGEPPWVLVGACTLK